ncbi:MAG: hypothetical protein ABMB14_01030 [Myxococcota bacterium]
MSDPHKPPPRGLRDLEDPTAAFPIGALRSGLPKRRSPAEEDTDRRHAVPLLDDDEDEDEYPELPLDGTRHRRVTVDLRFVALWLIAATMLAMMAAVAAAAALLLR